MLSILTNKIFIDHVTLGNYKLHTSAFIIKLGKSMAIGCAVKHFVVKVILVVHVESSRQYHFLHMGRASCN